MAHDVICAKIPVDSDHHEHHVFFLNENDVCTVTFDLIGLNCTSHQWYTGVYEETFDVNRKIAQIHKKKGKN